MNSNRHLQTGLSQQDFEVEKLSLGLEKCVSSMCVRERERGKGRWFFSHTVEGSSVLHSYFHKQVVVGLLFVLLASDFKKQPTLWVRGSLCD